MKATLRYHGVTESRAGPEYLVPALGYRSYRGIAKALVHAIQYDSQSRGRRLSLLDSLVIADKVEAMLSKTEVDPRLRQKGLYYSFTLDEKES